MQEKERIFVIGPVRKADVGVISKIGKHVATREAQGHKVYWPFRDTEQNDPTGGIAICTTHRRVIHDSTKVECYVDETSEASKFDLGMLYYLLRDGNKDFEVINEEELGWSGPGSMTLQDVFLELNIHASKESREAVAESTDILVLVDCTNPTSLFRMGMVFAALKDRDRMITLVDRDQISRTPHKSFENVFLALTEAVR
jgi:hypothetical protein